MKKLSLRALVRSLTRILVSLLVVCVLLLATIVSMVRVVVGGIDQFRPWLVGKLSERLDTDVTIANLRGDVRGVNLYLEMRGVAVTGGTGTPVLSARTLGIELDFVSSLRYLTWSLGELQVIGAKALIEQRPSGGFVIAGLGNLKAKPGSVPLFQRFAHLRRVRIADTQVDLHANAGDYRLWFDEDQGIKLTSLLGLRSFEATVSVALLDASGEPSVSHQLIMMGQYSGDPTDLDLLRGNLYVELPRGDVGDFLPRVRVGKLALERADLGVRVWAEAEGGSVRATAEVLSKELSLGATGKQVTLLSDLDLALSLEGRGPFDWNLVADRLQFVQGGTKWAFPDLRVGALEVGGEPQFVGHLKRIDLAAVFDALLEVDRATGFLPERPRAQLTAMDPGGVVEPVYFALYPARKPFDARVVGRVMDGHMNSYLGAPAISRVEAILSAGPWQGWIDVRNPAFDIHFASTFAKPWHFDSATGHLEYSYQPGLLSFGSPLLELKAGDMTVRGSFYLNLPRDRRAQTWGLAVGVRDGNIADKGRYLPESISEAAHSWLDRAVVSGQVLDSGMLFHGTLYSEPLPKEKAYELYFNARDAVLDYDPKWPEVTDLGGAVYIGNWGVSGKELTGKIFESEIERADVRLPFSAEGKPTVAQISGLMHGPAADGVRFLAETPLADTLNHLADGWQAEGAIEVDADLAIPIGHSDDESEESREAPDANVRVAMNGSNIFMPAYSLRVESIDGTIAYVERSGLSCDAFTARLLGSPASGRIVTAKGSKGREVRIALEGNGSVTDLYDWSGQTILTRAMGRYDYAATLRIPYGGSSQGSTFRATTDLVGVTVNLPPPLGKPPEEARPFSYTSLIGKDGQQVDLQYGDGFSAALKVEDGKVVQGLAHFGTEKARMPDSPGVTITGELPHVDLAEWEELRDDLSRKWREASSRSIEDDVSNSLNLISVRIGSIHVLGRDFLDVLTRIRRSDDNWVVDFINERMSGRLTVNDDAAQPMLVNLDYLKIDSDPHAGDVDPLANIDLTEMPVTTFSTDSFIWDGEDFGSWSFGFTPMANGAKISDLHASVKGLEIGPANEEGVPSTLTWTRNDSGDSSHFDGVIRSTDLARVLSEWGFAASIEGNDVRLRGQLSWRGSPATLSYERVDGELALKSGKGRFVQAKSGKGALQLMGIFDFASLAKRFKFDFSDVVDKGYAFDRIEGSIQLADGILHISKPLEIRSSGSTITVGGQVNLNTQELDNDLIITLPVSRNLPWFAALASGPLFGAGVYLAEKILLEEPIDQFSSAKYTVSGSMSDPEIRFVTIFDNSVRQNAAANGREKATGKAKTGTNGEEAPAANGGSGSDAGKEGKQTTESVVQDQERSS